MPVIPINAHLSLIPQDSNPRGVIRLLPGGWAKSVSQGSPRMTDAIANTETQSNAVISVVCVCMCVWLV